MQIMNNEDALLCPSVAPQIPHLPFALARDPDAGEPDADAAELAAAAVCG